MFGAILICLQAFIVQQITAQCIGAGYNGIVADGVSWVAAPWEAAALYPAVSQPAAERVVGLTLGTLGASACRGFGVRSTSPIAPTGVSVTSENVFDGFVVVQGTLPFLSAAALEGALPSVGSGFISYGCGNGDVVMLSEELGPASYAAPAYGPYAPYELGIGGIVGPTLGLALGQGSLGLGQGPLGLTQGTLGLGQGTLGLATGYGGCGGFIY
ncbi:chorion class B protein PC10-like [Aricia agestis]|uniref:chorion class B protein PC10-like n=1 Tax=Aricia agestis TaxID=91739 RepID=UPI001C206F50|nr:chorion class B protein PC10-like [Aricia agestis]